MYSKTEDIKDIYEVGEYLKIVTLPKMESFRPSRKHLPYINSNLTACARVYLHKELIKRLSQPQCLTLKRSLATKYLFVLLGLHPVSIENFEFLANH